MKRGSIGFLVIFLISIVSAAPSLTFQNNETQSGETILATITTTGNFYEKIDILKIKFYEGRRQVSFVFNVSCPGLSAGHFDVSLTKEFFRAFSVRGGMNLHINLYYGENEHHIIESIFKAAGRALDQATGFDERIQTVRSSKGAL